MIATIRRSFLQNAVRILTGAETCYVGALYLQRASLLALVIIAIVVALDISVHFQNVMSLDQQKIGIDGAGRLIYYALLRVSFVAPSVLLFAGVWGVVWSEYSLSISRERIMLFNCGHSHLFSLAPALLVGLTVGLVNFSIVAFVKPKTVELEATTTHRDYGPKFKQPITTAPTWISGDGFILNARIEIAESIGLKETQLYKFNEDGSIDKIITSEGAQPAAKLSAWRFSKAVQREFPFRTKAQGSERLAVVEKQFDELETNLALSSTWLENIGVLPTLLPHSVLMALIGDGQSVPHLYKYQMAVQERYAGIVYCVVVVLLSAYLALIMFPPNMLPFRALGVALVGFGVYFLYSVSLMFGHFGYLPVMIASWGIPVLIATILAGLVVRHEINVRAVFG